MTPKDTTIVFHVEPADRSVGIMSEGFSAWISDGAVWCDLVEWNEDPTLTSYRWVHNEREDDVIPPPYAGLVEGALHGYIAAWYQSHN